MGTVWAIWVICTCQIDNPASGTTRETRFVCISSFGFFMFETSAQIFFDIKFKTFSKALLLHHFIAITGYFMAVWFNVNHYVSVIAFILEASTPFSCVCYCLIKAGLESSMLWKVNQLVLIHVFHVRSVIECYMMYVMLSNWDKYAQIPPICFWHSFFSVLIVLVFLTPYWTYRKVFTSISHISNIINSIYYIYRLLSFLNQLTGTRRVKRKKPNRFQNSSLFY